MSIPNKRISEIITLILGGIGVVFLVVGVVIIAKSEGGFELLAGLIIFFYQFIFAAIAFPFLLKAFKREILSPWFVKYVLIESGLNFILVILQPIVYVLNGNSGIEEMIPLYGGIAILQLVPFLLHHFNKSE